MATYTHSEITDVRILPVCGVTIKVGADTYVFELLEEGSSMTVTPLYQARGNRSRLVAVRLDLSAIVMPNNYQDLDPHIAAIQEGEILEVVVTLEPIAGQSGAGKMTVGAPDPSALVHDWVFTWSATTSQWRPSLTMQLRGTFSKDVLDNTTYPFFNQVSGWS